MRVTAVGRSCRVGQRAAARRQRRIAASGTCSLVSALTVAVGEPDADPPDVAQGNGGACLLSGAPSPAAQPGGRASHRCPFGFEVTQSLAEPALMTRGLRRGRLCRGC